MIDEEEAIDRMARVIYNETRGGDSLPWDDLTPAVKHRWLVATARGWEAYWEQRGFLSRPR